MTEGILFATPAYGNMVTAAYCRSALVTMEELTRAGIVNDWLIPQNNDSLVHRARMKMAKTFLDRKDFSHLFWVDADIEYGPKEVAALWNLNADIAVGVYAMKKRDAQWFAAWKNGELVKNLDQFPGPIEVDYAGTGFMLIKRKVLETLAASVPKFDDDVKGIPALFMTPIHHGGLESEDYHFCRIAREAGYKIIMDPSVRLKHWGQYAFGAD